MFITVEGCEGAGKTTLLEGLKKYFESRGEQVVSTREPGGCALAEALRELLLRPPKGVEIGTEAETLLFLAARAQHIQQLIAPSLKAGKVVLCDRFNDSTVAYQGFARGLGVERVLEMCHVVCENVLPNLTFLLDIDPAEGLARAKKGGKDQDRIESEYLAFHAKVRAGFHLLAEREKERIKWIDARLGKEEVLRQALQWIN
ncbi:MAG: dTMP kinase [Verrucomicrobia bacterium]|nr:dTMP kinase [Verrucomicrobiota bacterium]